MVLSLPTYTVPSESLPPFRDLTSPDPQKATHKGRCYRPTAHLDRSPHPIIYWVLMTAGKKGSAGGPRQDFDPIPPPHVIPEELRAGL